MSMEFPRQEYWSGLPLPTPGELLGPGIEPKSLASPALAGRFFITSATWGAQGCWDVGVWPLDCILGVGIVAKLIVFSCTQLFATHQVPLSRGFFRQECWRGLPFPSPGDLPDPGIKSRSPVSLSL